MSYQPQFQITPALLARVEAIAAVRERIQSATVQVSWIPALQKDTRARNTHSSTAIEGNPLTLEEVRAAFAHPFLAILSALVLIVGMRHFAMGATMMIEDYAKGTARKLGVIFAISLSTVIAATGLFALIKIAL